MTKKTDELIEKLTNQVISLQEANKTFRDDMEKRIVALEQKNVPFNLEQDILRTIQTSLGTVLANTMTGYNSPLGKLSESVVTKHQNSIKTIMDEAMQHTISQEEFSAEIRAAYIHKIARILISSLEGQIDKIGNELKQDPKFRARATLAITNLVDEFTKGNG